MTNHCIIAFVADHTCSTQIQQTEPDGGKSVAALSLVFFFSSRRRHTRLVSDWSSDVCSSDLNAGIQFVSPIESFPIEKWDQIIAINLSAAFHAIRHAVPIMKSAKWGRIISTEIGRASCRERV